MGIIRYNILGTAHILHRVDIEQYNNVLWTVDTAFNVHLVMDIKSRYVFLW